MWLLLTIAFVLCITPNEARERHASLVVLPPLVLGYEDLYYEDHKGKSAEHLTKDHSIEPTVHHQSIEQTVKEEEPKHIYYSDGDGDIKNEDMDVKNEDMNNGSFQKDPEKAQRKQRRGKGRNGHGERVKSFNPYARRRHGVDSFKK